jgi:hypothetical protein
MQDIQSLLGKQPTSEKNSLEKIAEAEDDVRHRRRQHPFLFVFHNIYVCRIDNSFQMQYNGFARTPAL